jgi:CheY-like chemotaxis protein
LQGHLCEEAVSPMSSMRLKSSQVLPIVDTLSAIVPERSSRLRLLLAETNADSLLRLALLLSNSGYRVATASTRNEVFDLRSLAIHLAILSDSLGKSSLRGAAENVRRQWPRARILILGTAQTLLDDPLYDEAVDRRISPEDLLSTLVKLSAYPWNFRAEVSRCNGGADHVGTSEPNHQPAPLESDPTKAPGQDSEPKAEPQDLPAEERRNWRPLESS